jgi:hypothetical protein
MFVKEREHHGLFDNTFFERSLHRTSILNVFVLAILRLQTLCGTKMCILNVCNMCSKKYVVKWPGAYFCFRQRRA